MGSLTFTKDKFWFTTTSVSDLRLAKDAGFKWGDDSPFVFATRSIDKAVRLRKFADKRAEVKFKNHFITDLSPPEQILYPLNLEPKYFQLESAWHCLSKDKAYVADEAGLGKTITAILCMNSDPGKAIIICPPFLKYNWHDEIKKWATTTQSISIIESGSTLIEAFQAGVVILPDSLLCNPKITHYLKLHSYKWLIVDEAHRYKNTDAKRTTVLLGDGDSDDKTTGITDVAQRILFLSGTPIPNGKPIELYPLVSRVALSEFDSQSEIEFGKTFCAGKQVTRFEGRRAVTHWDFSGASNLKLLKKKLQRKFMIRHTKKDVLPELAGKTRKLVFLDTPSKLLKFERQLLKSHTLEELMGSQTGLGEIAKYQRQIGVTKLPQSIEYISDLLENSNDKLVVFAHHVEVVLGLNNGLKNYGCLVIRGGMSAAEKDLRVKLFQTQDCHRVIVGNLDAMGVGMTLTKAPGVVIVEPSWVPGINEQAEDRVHRISQDQNVYIRYLVLRDSLDERKLRSVLTKEHNINQVME